MSKITIEGDSKYISRIVREQRIRIKRGLVTVSGDTEDPKAKKPKASKKKEEPKVEAKEEKATPQNKEEKVSAKNK